jgi:hypothetical protein
VRVFRQKFTLEDAIGSHACSLEANTRVTTGIPLGSSLLLPLCTVNCVQTLKGLLLNTQKNVDANGCADTAAVAMLDWTAKDNADTGSVANVGGPVASAGGDGEGSTQPANGGEGEAEVTVHDQNNGRYVGSASNSSTRTSTSTDGSGGCSSSAGLLPVHGFDLIIAADVIYDPWHVSQHKWCADASGAGTDYVLLSVCVCESERFVSACVWQVVRMCVIVSV